MFINQEAKKLAHRAPLQDLNVFLAAFDNVSNYAQIWNLNLVIQFSPHTEEYQRLRDSKLRYATNMPSKITLKKQGCNSENWKIPLDFSDFQDYLGGGAQSVEFVLSVLT
jgi:hypothetical protein